MYIPAGSTGYWEAITEGIRAIYSAQHLLDITHNVLGGHTDIRGADASADDLFIYPNQIDDYSYLKLYGSGLIKLAVNTNSRVEFYNTTTLFGLFDATSGYYNIAIKETGTSPATRTGFGLLYTKSDNNLYFKDGDGTEHTVAFV